MWAAWSLGVVFWLWFSGLSLAKTAQNAVRFFLLVFRGDFVFLFGCFWKVPLDLGCCSGNFCLINCCPLSGWCTALVCLIEKAQNAACFFSLVFRGGLVLLTGGFWKVLLCLGLRSNNFYLRNCRHQSGLFRASVCIAASTRCCSACVSRGPKQLFMCACRG